MPGDHLISARTIVISVFASECHEAAEMKRMNKRGRGDFEKYRTTKQLWAGE